MREPGGTEAAPDDPLLEAEELLHRPEVGPDRRLRFARGEGRNGAASDPASRASRWPREAPHFWSRGESRGSPSRDSGFLREAARARGRAEVGVVRRRAARSPRHLVGELHPGQPVASFSRRRGGPARIRAEVDPWRSASIAPRCRYDRSRSTPWAASMAGEVVELRDARSRGVSAGDGAGGPAAQDVLDERGQVAARPDLDEHPRPRRRTAPRSSRGTRPGGPVLDHQLTDRRRIVRVRSRRRAGPERRPARRAPAAGRRPAAGPRRTARTAACATARSYGSCSHIEPVPADDLPSPARWPPASLADQHDLVRAVVHRHVQLAARLAGDAPRPARGSAPTASSTARGTPCRAAASLRNRGSAQCAERRPIARRSAGRARRPPCAAECSPLLCPTIASGRQPEPFSTA